MSTTGEFGGDANFEGSGFDQEKLIQLMCLFENKFGQAGLSMESASMMVGHIHKAIEQLATKILHAENSEGFNLSHFANDMSAIWQMQLEMSSGLMSEFQDTATAFVGEDGRLISGYANYASLFTLSGEMMSTFINWLVEHFEDAKGIDHMVTARFVEA